MEFFITLLRSNQLDKYIEIIIKLKQSIPNFKSTSYYDHVSSIRGNIV